MGVTSGPLRDTLKVVRRLRPTASAEVGRATLWPWPTVAGLAAALAGTAAVAWRPLEGSSLASVIWPGERDAGSTMLQLVPASVMTATSVTFSLVVVALQMASQQFSPRLLRQFTRDRVFKAVLAVLVATFAFSVSVLRGLDDEDVPVVALTVTYLSALASLGALVGFIAHVARALRVETMMVAVHDDTTRAIGRFHPGPEGQDRGGGQPPVGAVAIPARRSGFVQRVDAPGLVAAAVDADLTVWLAARPGDHVVRDTPLAWVAGVDRSPDELADIGWTAVEAHLRLGYERTLEQDPSLGFRELTDIAVKALSPGINDPVTADHALGHLGDLLVSLAERRLGPMEHTDDNGQLRLVTVDRDYRYYLELSCGQIRRFGSREPTVLLSILRMLRNVAPTCSQPHRRAEVRRQVELVLHTAETSDDAQDEDLAAMRDLAERVDRALAGDLMAAFTDRAGETRSM